jgi:hypothetical protein
MCLPVRRSVREWRDEGGKVAPDWRDLVELVNDTYWR